MRIKDETGINPGQAGAGIPAANNDWMAKLNDLVNNTRGAISQVKDIVALQKGLKPAGGEDPGPSAQGIGGFLSLIRAAGYGDKPIGQIITELAPYSVNQIEAQIKTQIKNKLLGKG
jgi:hypothetical protein